MHEKKFRLCAHVGVKQLGFNNWEDYSPMVYWISMRSLLSIASIH